MLCKEGRTRAWFAAIRYGSGLLLLHCIFNDNEICASCQNIHFNILLYFGFGKVCGFLSGMFSLQCLIIELPQGSSAEYSALLKWEPLLVGAFYQRTVLWPQDSQIAQFCPPETPQFYWGFNNLLCIYVLPNTNIVLVWLQGIPSHLQFVIGFYKSFPLCGVNTLLFSLLCGFVGFLIVFFFFFFLKIFLNCLIVKMKWNVQWNSITIAVELF